MQSIKTTIEIKKDDYNDGNNIPIVAEPEIPLLSNNECDENNKAMKKVLHLTKMWQLEIQN